MSRTKHSFWKISLSFFANVSYETLILEDFFVFFLRMSRTKRLFWKASLSVFANVSYETLILEDFLDAFKGGGDPLVGQNMIEIRLSSKELYKELASISYETLILEGLFVGL